jgi:hypothetical protein
VEGGGWRDGFAREKLCVAHSCAFKRLSYSSLRASALTSPDGLTTLTRSEEDMCLMSIDRRASSNPSAFGF